MSYDIHLNDPVTKQTIELENPHFMRGGTYAIDGTKELSLNITYNYACVFCRPDVLGEKGIRSIYGKTGAESIPVLQKAIDALTDEVDSDYHQRKNNEKIPFHPRINFKSFARVRLFFLFVKAPSEFGHAEQQIYKQTGRSVNVIGKQGFAVEDTSSAILVKSI